MIAANELRIGNWVNLRMIGIETDETPHQINARCLVDISEEQGAFLNKKCYSPIPLTLAILGKMEFEKWDEDISSGIIRFTKKHSVSKDFIVYIYSNGKIEFCIDCEDFSKVLNELQYLHQLQNLYFALTGKELTYNP